MDRRHLISLFTIAAMKYVLRVSLKHRSDKIAHNFHASGCRRQFCNFAMRIRIHLLRLVVVVRGCEQKKVNQNGAITKRRHFSTEIGGASQL